MVATKTAEKPARIAPKEGRTTGAIDLGAAFVRGPDISNLKLPSGYVLQNVEDAGRVEVASLALSAVVEMCSAVTNAGGRASSLADVNASNFACLLDLIVREIQGPVAS